MWGSTRMVAAFFEKEPPMSITKTSSNVLKTSFFALALAMSAAAPLAAHASPLANDSSFISEVNAAYGTHFVAQPAQSAARN